MRSNAIDSKNAGQRNEKFVIELLRQFGALSQADICKKSGLGSSTISYITARLRDKGLINEKIGQSSRPGAKPILIEINPTGQFVAGIAISPSRVYVGLFNFNTELIDSIKIAAGSASAIICASSFSCKKILTGTTTEPRSQIA